MAEDIEKPTILVAEDTESNYLLVSYLLRNDYRLVWAHDGVEALELYEKEHPQLILMDIRMPRLGGLATTEQIRRRLVFSGTDWSALADRSSLTLFPFALYPVFSKNLRSFSRLSASRFLSEKRLQR